nr:hypothetical protein [Tanacetum cinerariifolium]
YGAGVAESGGAAAATTYGSYNVVLLG